MNICLIGSMRNYTRMQQIANDLREHGHKVTLPVDLSESRFSDRQQMKSQFIKEMYTTIQTSCDSILTVNDEERSGYDGYIGPNTFLQLGMGYALGKNLFCLKEWDKRLPYNEELQSMKIQKLDLQNRF